MTMVKSESDGIKTFPQTATTNTPRPGGIFSEGTSTTAEIPQPTHRIFLPVPTRGTYDSSKNTGMPLTSPSQLTGEPTVDRGRVRPLPPPPAADASAGSVMALPSSTSQPRPEVGALPPPPSVALDNLAFTRGAAASPSTSTEWALTGDKPDRRPILAVFSRPHSSRYRPRPRPSRRTTAAPASAQQGPHLLSERRPESESEPHTSTNQAAAIGTEPATRKSEQVSVSADVRGGGLRRRPGSVETKQVVDVIATELPASLLQQSAAVAPTTRPALPPAQPSEQTNQPSAGGNPFLSSLFGKCISVFILRDNVRLGNIRQFQSAYIVHKFDGIFSSCSKGKGCTIVTFL